MRKSLQGPLFVVALFFLVLPSISSLASGPHDLPHSKKSTQSTSHQSFTLSAPADLTINTDPWLNVATRVALGQPAVSSPQNSFSATDQATGYVISNDAPARYPLGTTLVTWKATDATGNTATAVQKVTVVDQEKPFIFRNYEISVVNEPGKCGATVQLFTPDYYDNSGAVTFTNDAPAYFEVGSRLITWTATDQYGNSDTSTQLITVIDNEEPTISVTDITVSNATGKCGAPVNLGTPVVGDNCGIASVENNAPAFFNTGTTLVYWLVTDKSGYTSFAVQKVTVLDTEKPRIAPPAALALGNTAGKCGYTGTLAPPAVSDNCGLRSIVNNAPATLPVGTTIVTWTATDNNGNQSSINQSVTVKDAEAPVFVSIPANSAVGCEGVPPAATPLVQDNCTASPVITYTQTSTQGNDATKPARYNYTITRTWTARDAAGNTSTAKQLITVQDRTAPVINVPTNIVRSNDANSCGAVVTYNVSASDACGSPVTLTYSKPSGTQFATGTTVVTVTARDVSGNTTTQSFSVTINDTQKPAVKAPSNVSAATGNTSIPRSGVNLGTPSYSDNCGVASITNNAPDTYPVGVTTVTWYVTDVNGNVGTATQNVTVSSTRRKNEIGAIGSGSVEPEKNAVPSALTITVAPNPTTTYFTLRIQSRNDLPVNLRVVDAQGRTVDTRTKLGANSSVQVGFHYMPGLYFAEFIQGEERKTIQLLKVR